MIEWGDEFFNVRSPEPGLTLRPLRTGAEMPVPAVGGDWTDFARQANSNAATLQRILNHLDEGGGGIAYFPPGRYYIGRNRDAPGVSSPVEPRGASLEAADILVPPDVTLRFAPGAVLVPLNFEEAGLFSAPVEGRPDEQFLVIIEVQGEIEADIRPIFDTVVRSDTSNDESPLLAGMVIFSGTRVREVYPEWWNATAGEVGRQNTRAFQAAIDAAHTRRHRPRRTRRGDLVRNNEGGIEWWRLPPLAVCATATYIINTGLEVGALSDFAELIPGRDPALLRPNTDPFVLLGAREVGNAGRGVTTLQRGLPLAQPGVAEPPILLIRGIPGFTVRDVHFNGAQATNCLLRIELGGGHGHAEVTNCVFTRVDNRDLATLVIIESSLTEGTDGASGDVGSRSNLAFTRCHFQTDPYHSTEVFDRRPRGVSIDVTDDVNVEFRATFLHGKAAPMIAAIRGKFTLNECQMHTVRFSPATVVSSADGADVFISRPRTVRGRREAPACFSCREVESQSFQFLATFSGGDPAPPGIGAPHLPTGTVSACVLVSTHHNAVVEEHEPAGWERSARASIFWDGPARNGSHLVMVGCRNKAEYGLQTNGTWSGLLGAVRVGPDPRGRIYNLANTTFDQVHVAEIDLWGITPPGFIRSIDEAVALTNVHQLSPIPLPGAGS